MTRSNGYCWYTAHFTHNVTSRLLCCSQKISDCISDISSWMKTYPLELNLKKKKKRTLNLFTSYVFPYARPLSIQWYLHSQSIPYCRTGSISQTYQCILLILLSGCSKGLKTCPQKKSNATLHCRKNPYTYPCIPGINKLCTILSINISMAIMQDLSVSQCSFIKK